MPLQVPSGTGPRHGGFARVGLDTYFYIVGQISDMIESYKVTYSGDDELEFTHIETTDTRIRPDGSAIPAPQGVEGMNPSEFAISVHTFLSKLLLPLPLNANHLPTAR